MVKNPPSKAGDAGSIPGSGRSPGGGKGCPLQYSGESRGFSREASWREEPGGLQSVESQRVGHDRVTKHSTSSMANILTTQNTRETYYGMWAAGRI